MVLSSPLYSILLFQDGRLLKLCDFGTARKLQHTLTNAVGTVLYMAPEVIKSEASYSVWLMYVGIDRSDELTVCVCVCVCVCVHACMCV